MVFVSIDKNLDKLAYFRPEFSILSIWDIRTGRLVFQNEDSKYRTDVLCFDKTLVSTESGALRIWNLENRIDKKHSLSQKPQCLSINSNKNVLAVGSIGFVSLIDLQSGSARTHNTSLLANKIGFSNDSKYLWIYCVESRRLYVYKLQGFEKVADYYCPVTAVTVQMYDNKIYMAGSDYNIVIYDIVSKESDKIRGHNDMVNSIDISHDGKFLASGGADKMLRIWELETKKEVASFDKINVNNVSFSETDNTKLISYGGDDCVRVFDLDIKRQMRSFYIVNRNLKVAA